jgi:hypothetical protein
MRVADGRVFRLGMPSRPDAEAEGEVAEAGPRSTPADRDTAGVAGVLMILGRELEEALDRLSRLVDEGEWPGGEQRTWWDTWCRYRDAAAVPPRERFNAARDAFEQARRLQEGIAAERRPFSDLDRLFFDEASAALRDGVTACRG